MIEYIILDLDHTLMYTSRTKINNTLECGFIEPNYWIYCRPGLQELINICTLGGIEIIIYSAGTKTYVNKILYILQILPFVTFVTNKNNNTTDKAIYDFSHLDLYHLKSMDIVLQDFPQINKNNVLVIDDNPDNYSLDDIKVINIIPWYGDETDIWLYEIVKYIIQHFNTTIL